MVNRPAFFKFYLPGRGEENRKIPSIFVRSIQGAWPNNVTLRDRHNNVWQVKVDKVGDSWYFNDGWTKFANDNMIKGGDMLVYKYFSKDLFDFKVFGPSACEEKRAVDLKYKNTEELDKMLESDDDGGDDIDDDDYMPTASQESQRDGSPRGEEVMGGGNSASSHGNKRNCDWYGTEIFRSGLVPQPINPYFVTKTRPNRAGELYIPVDCIKCFNLQLPETIMLVDPRGRTFQAKRKMWKDGRIFYTQGWKRLCRMNLVREDDKCICEFIQEDGGNLYLSVSFSRANRQQR